MVSELIDQLVQLLNHPLLRAASIVIAAASLIVSLWVAKRTASAINTHTTLVQAEHARFLEQQWQNIDRLTVTNDDCAKLLAEMFGSSPEAEKKDAAHLLFISGLAAAHSQLLRRAIDDDFYRSHMTSFFSNYKGDKEYLRDLIKRNYGIAEDFVGECEKYLGKA